MIVTCKWPQMVVVGDPVTPDQAAEIIVRTSRWPLFCNAHDWLAETQRTLGIPAEPSGYDYAGDATSARRQWERIDQWRADHRVLSLNYLHTSRIASSWVGGAHGWCAWDGTIGCDNYNIGKWPSAEDVLEDWTAIAAAFPFLRLRCQLFSEETGADDAVPTVEYAVADGRAVMQEPGEPLPRYFPTEEERYTEWRRLINEPAELREVGCSVDQLRHGLALARAATATNRRESP